MKDANWNTVGVYMAVDQSGWTIGVVERKYIGLG